MDKVELNRLLLRARGLAAFRGVLDSNAGQDFLALLGLLAATFVHSRPFSTSAPKPYSA
jgi:hypothetical protein